MGEEDDDGNIKYARKYFCEMGETLNIKKKTVGNIGFCCLFFSERVVS